MVCLRTEIASRLLLYSDVRAVMTLRVVRAGQAILDMTGKRISRVRLVIPD